MDTRSLHTTDEQPLRVFVSYAHEDERYCRELQKHLSFLTHADLVDCWYDRRIRPGDDWKGKIDCRLDDADVILLLLSPDFGASNYCWDVEARKALERHYAGEAKTIPIIIRPVDGWQDTPLGALQALPENGRAVTLWRTKDEGYNNIVQSLRKLLSQGAAPNPRTTTDRIVWTITVTRAFAEFNESKLAEFALQMRIYTRDIGLELLVAEEGSTKLKIQSTREAYTVVRAAYSDGVLDKILGESIIELSEPVGALVRIETALTSHSIEPSLTYLPDTLGRKGGTTAMPPLIMGMAFSPDNWLQPGFKLGYSSSDASPSPEEQVLFQERLARYFNTFLVVQPGNLNVSLSPLRERSGLPEPLRHTELGRDLLAQDVALKYSTACLLYPASEPGGEFWRRVEDVAPANNTLESCMRVWIVPGAVTLKESMDQGLAHVDIEKLSLEVLCESDYDALTSLRGQSASTPTRVDGSVLTAFRDVVLPRVQEEVSSGMQFGILRQILSVLVIATWFRKNPIASYLRDAGFLDSDDTARFNLKVVGNEVEELHRQYLELFRAGVWRYGKCEYDLEGRVVRRRLLIAGAIDLSGRSAHSRLFT